MREHNRAAFTLPELMISMTIFSIITTMIVVLYHSVTVSYRHNFVRMENSEKAREALRRIVPMISSACPSGPGSAIYRPDPNVVAPYPNSVVGPVPIYTPDNTTVLMSTRQFIDSFIYNGPTTPNYVPMATDQFSTYRLWFQPDASTTARSQASAGGRIGDVWMDPNTPSDATDDRCVARSVYDVSFTNMGSNRLLVTVEVYGLDRGATNAQILRRLSYKTEVWLPYYSNTVGN